MPYKLVKSVAGGKRGWRVRAEDGTYKSKNAIPLERAKRQMRALYMSEHMKK